MGNRIEILAIWHALCVACVQEVSAKPKASLLTSCLGIRTRNTNFQNRKNSFLIKRFMVCFFPPCCTYLIEAGKCTCKFPFQWLFLAMKNLTGCYIYPSPTPIQKSPSSSVLTILGFRRLQNICLLTALQQS